MQKRHSNEHDALLLTLRLAGASLIVGTALLLSGCPQEDDDAEGWCRDGLCESDAGADGSNDTDGPPPADTGIEDGGDTDSPTDAEPSDTQPRRDTEATDTGGPDPDDTSGGKETGSQDTSGGDTSRADTRGDATGRPPCVQLSHSSRVDFGLSSLNQTARRTVTVQNCGSNFQPLVIKSIKVNGDRAFGLDTSSLPGQLANGGQATIRGDATASFVLEFKPTAQKPYSGEVTLFTNDPARPRVKLNLKGRGADNACPNAVAEGKVAGTSNYQRMLQTAPLETIQLDGTRSQAPNGSIARYEWTLISRPTGSTARLTPSSSVKKPKLFLDLAGTYEVELVVYDQKGTASCGTQAIVTIKAVPSQDIYVEMVWDTPGDTDQTDTNGADVDLHYLHAQRGAWNKAPWDVFWHNKNPDWGQQGSGRDDPRNIVDDAHGAGPEITAHDNPASGGQYKVASYYYADNGFGPSYVTTRVYLRSKLEASYKNQLLPKTYAFWHIATIRWPSATVTKGASKSRQNFP